MDEKKKKKFPSGKKEYVKPVLVSFGLLSMLPGTASANSLS